MRLIGVGAVYREKQRGWSTSQKEVRVWQFTDSIAAERVIWG